MNNGAALLRESVIQNVMNGRFGTFHDSRHDFLLQIGIEGNSAEFLDVLGERLNEVFTKAHGGVGAERSNSTVAIAGTLWESLAIAYLNTALAGTCAAAVGGSRFIPEVIRRMLLLNGYDGIVSPSYSTFIIEHPALRALPYGNYGEWDQSMTLWLDGEIREDIESLKLILLDCRTNFSDTIKEPLLYDWIVGMMRSGNLPHQIDPKLQNSELVDYLPRAASVSLAVITGAKNSVKARSAQARRAELISGGVHWGRPNSIGVARCLSDSVEYFIECGLISPREDSHSETKNEIRKLAHLWT